jgi:murein DD-endopeptidase MepM/ murein hydrolase activator NlpD
VAALAVALLVAGCTAYRAPDREARVPRARATADAAARPAIAPLPSLKPPPEQRAPTLAAAGKHLVVPGDSLLALALSYDIPVRELARRNRIDPPYDIRVGQVLDVRDSDPALPRHVVRPGESLSLVAARYGIRVGDLARANGLEQLDLIKTGQRLRIPAADAPAGGGGPAVADGGGGTIERVAMSQGDGGAAAAAVAGSGRDAAASLTRSARGFLWPVQGKVISTFGLKRSGRRNDGINVAARPGTPVRAAEDGIVVYVGDGFRGYGRMVLLRHPDGYTTAYAHNSAVLVRELQQVARGDVIARVGSTGAVAEPQLHFELRREGLALDPQRHLRRDTTTVAASTDS